VDARQKIREKVIKTAVLNKNKAFCCSLFDFALRNQASKAEWLHEHLFSNLVTKAPFHSHYIGEILLFKKDEFSATFFR
jgi:hypothetical protein